MTRVQGFLQDGMDTLDYVMTRNNVMPRMNARVLGVAKKYVDMSQHMCTLKPHVITHCLLVVTLIDKHSFNGLFSRTSWVVVTRNVKPVWILMKQEMMR